jgi:DNA-binding GntR family transcriptional regulator
VRKQTPSVKTPRLPRESAIPPAPETKLAHLAYDKIRKAIIYGRLDLGEPLSENDLAEALGVSKAPIRESLNELRLKGLVEVIPQSGSYVFSPTHRQVEELCDFRSLLEERAVRLSMQNDAKSLLTATKKILREMKKAYKADDLLQSKVLDTEFHQSFFLQCDNDYLIQSYASVGLSIAALRYRFMDTSAYRSRAFEEHQRIVELLNDGNVPRAVATLVDHISRTKQYHTEVTWSSGRLRRRDYKFRDYTNIFADL